jgi:hypothetical protein
MYLGAFIDGVLATILAELVTFVVAALVVAIRRVMRHGN